MTRSLRSMAVMKLLAAAATIPVLWLTAAAGIAVVATADGDDDRVEKLMERTHEGRRSPYAQLRRIVGGQGATWPVIEQNVQAFEPMGRALAESGNDEIRDSADGYLTAVKELTAAVKRRDAAGVRAGFESLTQSCGDCHFKGGVGGMLEDEHEDRENRHNEDRKDQQQQERNGGDRD